MAMSVLVLRIVRKAFKGYISYFVLRMVCKAFNGHVSTLCYTRFFNDHVSTALRIVCKAFNGHFFSTRWCS
jgi:hypothetical protein